MQPKESPLRLVRGVGNRASCGQQAGCGHCVMNARRQGRQGRPRGGGERIGISPFSPLSTFSNSGELSEEY